MTRSLDALDDEEHRSVRRGLLDALLAELADDDERAPAFCELLVPGVSRIAP